MDLPVYRGFKILKALDGLAERAKRIPDDFCVDEEREIYYGLDDTLYSIARMRDDMKDVIANDAAGIIFVLGALSAASYRRWGVSSICTGLAVRDAWDNDAVYQNILEQFIKLDENIADLEHRIGLKPFEHLTLHSPDYEK